MPIRVVRPCNQRCAFCNVDPDDPHEKFHVTLPEVHAALDQLKPGTYVEISGGEPTLHPELPAIVQASTSRGFDTTLQTNAIRVTPQRARALAKAGLRSAFVSLHAPTAALSDEITGAPGTWVKTLAGIDALRAVGVLVTLNFVAHARNMAVLPDFVRFVYERFGGDVRLSLSAMSYARDNVMQPDMMFRYAEAREPFSRAIDLAIGYGIPCTVPLWCGMPACVLPGYESFLNSWVSDVGGLDAHKASDKVKFEGCASCAYNASCSGVWPRYAENFGTAEFVPVSREQGLERETAMRWRQLAHAYPLRVLYPDFSAPFRRVVNRMWPMPEVAEKSP